MKTPTNTPSKRSTRITRLPKEERLVPHRFFSTGGAIPSSIAFLLLALIIINLLNFFINLLTYGSNARLSRKDPPSLVQMANGELVSVAPLGSKERTPEVIKRFTQETMTGLFNWTGYLPLESDNSPTPDPGIEVKVERDTHRITTETWMTSFRLSESDNFREEFTQKIATLTPDDVFSQRIKVILVIRELTEPVKLGEGKYEVGMVANLLTFDRRDNTGKGIPFNKSIILEVIEPPILRHQADELEQIIYHQRKAGLEITTIKPLERPNL